MSNDQRLQSISFQVALSLTAPSAPWIPGDANAPEPSPAPHESCQVWSVWCYKNCFVSCVKKIGCAWKWDTIPLPPKWPSYYMENDDEPVDGYHIFRPTNRSKIPNAYWSYINQLTETFYGMDFTRQGPGLRILLSFANMLPYWRLTSSLPLWILDPTTTAAPSSDFTLEHHPFLCMYVYIYIYIIIEIL